MCWCLSVGSFSKQHPNTHQHNRKILACCGSQKLHLRLCFQVMGCLLKLASEFVCLSLPEIAFAHLALIIAVIVQMEIEANNKWGIFVTISGCEMQKCCSP